MTTRRRLGRWTAAVGLTVLVGIPLTGAVAAAAEAAPATAAVQAVAPRPTTAPLNLPTQITDQAEALDSGDRAEVQSALDELARDTGIVLYVVYVPTFDNPTDGVAWAQQTGQLSGMGSDNIVLAVATQGRSYGVAYPSSFTRLTASQINSVTQNDIVPALRNSDWAGAALAAADGYRKAAGGGGSAWWWVAGGVVVAGGGGYLVYRRRARKTADGGPGAGSTTVGPDGQPQPVEPYQQLSDRSVQALIDTDNAVRASEFELSAAESEFGTTAAADFRRVFEASRESLAGAFALRQQIDDDVPESEADRRAMMEEILQRCAQASSQLEAESEHFSGLRDLRSRLPQVIAELPSAIEAQQARIPTLTQTLDRLRQRYAPAALATVADNIDQANSRLAFARTSGQQAAASAADIRDAAPATGSGTAAGTPAPTGAPAAAPPSAPAAAPAGAPAVPVVPDDARTTAVLAAGAAQEAVGQAQTLLDAIERTEHELSEAGGRLAQAVSAVEAELAANRTALAGGNAGAAGPGLQARLDQVAAVLDVARSPQGAADPLTALAKVQEADEALDEIAVATHSAQEEEQRAAATLQQVLSTARAEVASATDFVSTRRGAIGSEARTRLAEASRHLAAAEELAGSSAAQATAEGKQAITLARAATQLAQQDVSGWGGGGRSGGSGGLGGAILGGILIDSVLNSGRRGGGGGGWGGGFGGGGFGGGGSRGGGGGGGGWSSGGGGRF